MDSEFVRAVREDAEKYFMSGFLCAEAVVMSLAKAQGIESDLLTKISTAFCSGISRTCGTCGALTGAIMGISLNLGRSTADQNIQPSYKATQRLIREFEQKFGSRDCYVLLGCDLGTTAGQATYLENHLDEQCVKYISEAAEIGARILIVSAN